MSIHTIILSSMEILRLQSLLFRQIAQAIFIKIIKIKVWVSGSSDGALIAGAANEWLWENLNYV